MWTVDSFTPSDTKAGSDGLPSDHQAWLAGPSTGGCRNFAHVQMSTWGIDAEQARAFIDKMVAALNDDAN